MANSTLSLGRVPKGLSVIKTMQVAWVGLLYNWHHQDVIYDHHSLTISHSISRSHHHLYDARSFDSVRITWKPEYAGPSHLFSLHQRPAADHGSYRRFVSANTTWWWPDETTRGWWWRSHLAENYGGNSTRQIIILHHRAHAVAEHLGTDGPTLICLQFDYCCLGQLSVTTYMTQSRQLSTAKMQFKKNYLLRNKHESNSTLKLLMPLHCTNSLSN